MIYSGKSKPRKVHQESSIYDRFLSGEFASDKHYMTDIMESHLEESGKGNTREVDSIECHYQHPEFTRAVTEHFDIMDSVTRKSLINLNEAEQESVLTTLTSKLYDNIVDKANDVDYGDIPNTKGDISKLPNIDKLKDSVTLLRDIVKQYKQDPAPIDVLAEAIANIETRKTMFERAYRYDIELPIIMYNTTVLSIITGTSYMVAACIEFIKSPKEDTFETVLDTISYKKAKDHVIYNTLKRFNKSCKSGEFDRAMDYLVEQKAKNLTGAVAASITVGAIAMVALILNIIPILREMVFFIYYTRTRVSDFFDIQADLLQMNAYNIEHREANVPEDKKKIAEKQFKVSQLFRSIANKISITSKSAESKTAKDISAEDKKFKIDEITDGKEQSISVLF